MNYCEFCGKQLDKKECTCEESVRKKLQKKKATKLSILVSSIALILFVTVAVVVSVISTANKIDPFKYVEVTFTGYNTNGTTDIRFKKSDLIYEIIGEEPDDEKKFYIWEASYDELYDAIKCEISKESDLLNGDEVIITISVDSKTTNKIKNGSKTFTVSDLPEISKIDFFDKINLRFEGISGSGRAVVEFLSNEEYMKQYNIKIEPQYRLSNNEKVTLTITNHEDIAEKHLILPKELTKEYTVKNLSAYVTDVSQIPSDLIDEIAKKFEKEVSERLSDDSIYSYSNVQYHSSYFMNAKDDIFFADTNRLEILVGYDEYKNGKKWRTVHTILEFKEIMINADGSVDLKYEDGVNSTFTTDVEQYKEKCEEYYIVYDIEK